MSASTGVYSQQTCVSCQRPFSDSLFCPYCGTFIWDQEGTVVVASRLERLGSWLVNIILTVLTLWIGWIIWWFIVAPRGQNPGKAVVGLRVIKTDGSACGTGYMFLRGLVGIILGVIPFYLDDLWILWDKSSQTLHDKVASTVVVKARGSEKIVEQGSLGQLPAGVSSPPAYAPPVSLPGRGSPPAPPPAGPSQDVASQIEKLAALHDAGAITDEEFAAKKAELLSRM
ncbi:MAG: RDD family protein [Dehalococcoidia bacterium]|jgi:uncharacterized RDD family membrane protein YckC